MLEADAFMLATKARYEALFAYVENMRVRQKRQLFTLLRTAETVTPDTFLPAYGLHCGEFACFQILSEHVRKEAKRNMTNAEGEGPPHSQFAQ